MAWRERREQSVNAGQDPPDEMGGADTPSSESAVTLRLPFLPRRSAAVKWAGHSSFADERVYISVNANSLLETDFKHTGWGELGKEATLWKDGG